MPRHLLACVLLPGLLASASASVAPGSQTRQAAGDDPLFKTLTALDTSLFEAFNRCDLDTFRSMFADDVEFFHDKAPVLRGREAVVASVKQNICGRTRRDPIPETFEVHPMDDYGALQMGSHRFCDAGLPRCDGRTGGLGKFIHLWRKTGDTWALTRVISYDHVPAAP